MEQLLQLFVFIPLLGFVLSLLFANKQEKLISGVAYSIVGLQLAGLSVFIVSWLLHGASVLNLKHFVFYKEDTIEIFLDFYSLVNLRTDNLTSNLQLSILEEIKTIKKYQSFVALETL